jgi:hypothetical protein
MGDFASSFLHGIGAPGIIQAGDEFLPNERCLLLSPEADGEDGGVLFGCAASFVIAP